MAVIPQYSAEGPAQSRAPVLESGQSVRLDPRGVLSSLDGLAQSLSGAAAQNPTLPGNLGQGRAQGTGALGRGVAKLADLFQSLELEKAEARNYADEAEASQAMARMAGDFAEWRERNPDSSRWESELSSRLDDFRGRYYEGKEISPVARERIESNFDRFVTDLTVDTKLSAVKAEVGRAKRAAKANWDLAVHNQDLEGARAISAKMTDRQWIHPDEAALMDIEAEEKIRERQISEAKMRAETFSLRGDSAGGRAEILNAPFWTQDERENALAVYDRRDGVNADTFAIAERLAEGEDPQAVKADLRARNEDGSYVHYSNLPAAVREQEIAKINQEINGEVEAVAKELARAISVGEITNESEMDEWIGSVPVDGLTRRELLRKIEGEAISIEEEVLKYQLAAANYNPETDPDGVGYTSIVNRAAILLGEDPRLGPILETAEKRRRGESLTAEEEMLKTGIEEVRAVQEAEGTWVIPADRVKAAKDDAGNQIFVDTGADIKPGDPGWFETGEGWFDGKHIKGRIVQLSQKDRNNVLSKKPVGNVEDINERSRRAAETARVVDSINKANSTGKIQSEEDFRKEYEALTLPIKDRAAESTIESSLFPSASPSFVGPADEDPAEALKRRAAQLKGSATF